MEHSTTMTNRSLRTIKAELEYLVDAELINEQTFSSILSQLPEPSSTRTANARSPAPSSKMANMNLNSNEKQEYTPSVSPTPQQPPPAYPSAPEPPQQSTLTYATALYTYSPTDAGDLALSPQDRIAVTEYMNAEWWKGRSERTGSEGIFPRSYVKVEDKLPPPTPNRGTSYGNMPLEVAEGSNGGGRTSSFGGVGGGKGNEMGKKMGKKVGNAALFGAGATLGGKVVNGIF